MAMVNKFYISIFTLSMVVSVEVWADSWADSYQLEALQQYRAAADKLENIVKADSKNEFAVMRYGWLLYLSGDYSKSIKMYTKAIKLNETNIEAMAGVMLPLMAQSRWREAAAYAKEALKIAPWHYYAHIRLMTCEEAMGQWKNLARHASEVTQRYPSDATVLVYLARAQNAIGSKSQAGATYEKVLQRVPGHIEATTYINK